jgi:hypothetical protein
LSLVPQPAVADLNVQADPVLAEGKSQDAVGQEDNAQMAI